MLTLNWFSRSLILLSFKKISHQNGYILFHNLNWIAFNNSFRSTFFFLQEGRQALQLPLSRRYNAENLGLKDKDLIHYFLEHKEPFFPESLDPTEAVLPTPLIGEKMMKETQNIFPAKFPFISSFFICMAFM